MSAKSLWFIYVSAVLVCGGQVVHEYRFESLFLKSTLSRLQPMQH